MKFFEIAGCSIHTLDQEKFDIGILDKLGYNFIFGTGKVILYRDSLVIGSGLLCGSLYRLELSVLPSVSATLTVNTTSSSKCLTQWHKRLGHISKQRIERLIKEEILPDLDFSNFDTCVD